MPYKVTQDTHGGPLSVFINDRLMVKFEGTMSFYATGAFIAAIELHDHKPNSYLDYVNITQNLLKKE